MKNKILIIVIVLVAFVAGIVFGPRFVSAPKSDKPADNNNTSELQVSVVTMDTEKKGEPTVKISYPQFPSLDREYNNSIKNSVESRLSLFRQALKENNQARLDTASPGEKETDMGAYAFYASWTPAEMNTDHISFIIRFDSYVGGANSGQEIQTFNYDISRSSEITLDQLFANVPNYLDKLSMRGRKELSSSLEQASPGYDPDQNMNEGTMPLKENFSNFTVKDGIMTFYFTKYSVAPGAFGEQKFSVPMSEIK